MSFENSVGESGLPLTERRSEGDSIWRMKHMREKVKDFVNGVRQTSRREAVHNLTEAAGEAKNQAKDYVEHTTVRGVADDVARIIRRYPIQSLVIGIAAGFLLFRRRGNQHQ